MNCAIVGELEETLALSAPKTGAGELCLKETPVPYPLPMPAYGGYFVPIYELLPAGDLPNPPYQRYKIYCNYNTQNWGKKS